MDSVLFDTIPRRLALAALSAVGLGAAATPLTAEAKNKHKHKHKKSNAAKKAKQKCQQQNGQCTEFFAPYCAGDPGCTGQVKGCCALAGNCDVIGFYDCLVA